MPLSFSLGWLGWINPFLAGKLMVLRLIAGGNYVYWNLLQDAVRKTKGNRRDEDNIFSLFPPSQDLPPSLLTLQSYK